MDPYGWYDPVRALTTWLVGIPSVHGTPGEAALARAIHQRLAALPYFQAHPQHLVPVRTLGDNHDRYSLFALVQGGADQANRQAVLLTCHLDTVGTENYGALEPWARDPGGLAANLPRHWQGRGPGTPEAEALADLASGQYLFGRGALDTKSGVAMGLAVLERFADTVPEQAGSVVLVITPDEEEDSRGMVSAVQQLPTYLDRWGLIATAVIALDHATPLSPGNEARPVYAGSVGKLLVSLYIAGLPGHIDHPLAGLNPILLGAEVARRLEGAAALADSHRDATAPPPTCLRLTDLRRGYDVSQPPAVWSYFNLLTVARSPVAALQQVVREVEAAFADCRGYLAQQAAALPGGVGGPGPAWTPRVLTFAELRTVAIASNAFRVRQALGDLAAQCRDDPAVDTREYALRVTEVLWQLAGLKAPAAVVGVAGLYYPPVQPPDDRPAGRQLLARVAGLAAALGGETGEAIRLCHYLPGVSEMSFLGGQDHIDDLTVIEANSPGLNEKFPAFYGGAARLGNPPVLNIGPFGKDPHGPGERVHAPYTFGVAPELVWRTLREHLAG